MSPGCRPARVAALALLAAFLALPLPARAADDLATARAAFEYGQYERARGIAEDLIARGQLPKEEDLLEAYRIVGLAHFYSRRPDRLERAERTFLQLLSIDPDYRLDPFFTPPAAVTFVEDVRRKYASELEPIREQRRLVRAAQRAQEEMRRKLVEAAQKKEEEAPPQKVKLVTKRHFPVVFLPFGAGQFQNDEPKLGAAVATVQLAAGLASVISYAAIEGLRDPSGGFARGDLATANTLDVVKWATAGIFYVAWGFGVADAWSKYTPETVKELEVEPAPAPAAPADGAEPLAGPDPPVETSALDLSPFVTPHAGGGLLGLSLRF
jgi:tetratricopeptide (TPR) repeat protein